MAAAFQETNRSILSWGTFSRAAHISRLFRRPLQFPDIRVPGFEYVRGRHLAQDLRDHPHRADVFTDDSLHVPVSHIFHPLLYQTVSYHSVSYHIILVMIQLEVPFAVNLRPEACEFLSVEDLFQGGEMRRPGHVLILDRFGELALVLAVHVFSGLDAPGLFVPGVELDPRDRGSSEEIAEVVRPPARACDLFRLELRRRDLGFLGGMYPKLDPYPVKRCVWVDVLLPLFVAFFVDDRLIRGLLPAELERAPALLSIQSPIFSHWMSNLRLVLRARP